MGKQGERGSRVCYGCECPAGFPGAAGGGAAGADGPPGDGELPVGGVRGGELGVGQGAEVRGAWDVAEGEGTERLRFEIGGEEREGEIREQGVEDGEHR